MKIPLLLSLIAGVSTVIGGVLIFFKYKKINNLIVVSLSFSLTIMTLISIFDLMPSSAITIIKYYKIWYGVILIFLTFCPNSNSINPVF